jgi:ribonuclease HII
MSLTFEHIIGIDEVGRGPLAGPVTICVCKVHVSFNFKHFRGIKDSKQLTPEKREKWFLKISDLKEKGELDFAFSSVSAAEIDTIGIVPAIKKAMKESLDALNPDPATTRILLDGALKAPREFILQETIIKGDEKIPVISAASIVAKVMRDRYMKEQASVYPGYGFENHKGYGTDEHCENIRKLGLTPLHRKSFLSRVI